MVPSERTRGKKHKLKYRKSHLTIRKQFIIVRVVEVCHRLPTEAVESSPLEILRSQLDTVLSNLL